MKKVFSLAVGALIMMLAGGSLSAQALEGEGKHKGEWRTKHMEGQIQKLFNDLNLSEEQKKLLDENKKNHREQMGTLRKSMRELRLQIHAELEKSELDMSRISQLQGQLKEAQGKMLDYRLEGILSVHKILTPEQYKEFSKQMKERKDNFRKKMSEKLMKSKDSADDSIEVPSEVPSGIPESK